MSRNIFRYSVVVASLLATALFAGCGTSNKEGNVSVGEVATAGADTACIQCHSAVLDPLTNEGKMAQYVRSSPHKDSTHIPGGLNGCEACHGGGALHNGVGPIPYVNPYAGNGTRCATCHQGNYATNAPTKFADSLHANMAIETGGSCRRCHTHEGAVLGNVYGVTGSKAVVDTYQNTMPMNKEFTAFQCSTCHEHGAGLRSIKARDTYIVNGVIPAGVGIGTNLVNWNPSKSNQSNDQYNLCTSCHNLKTYDGNYVMASGTAGTAQVGHHETSWYRVIATTHNNAVDNTATGSNGITGYVIRIPKTAPDAYSSTTNPDAKPCFDCHAHEAKTGTSASNPNSSSYDATKASIYTEWSNSGHAGKLLTAKVAAAGAFANTTSLVINVMNAKTTAAAWAEPGHDWSATAQQDCQRCHTATGSSNYLNGPAKYDKTKNDFQHLSGWKTTAKASKQHEVLYCWGCHSNSGAGVVRNPGAMTADYNFNGAKAAFPDTGNSNVCITCHSGRDSGETITALADAGMNNVSFKNSHYMAAAGLMYVKDGFTGFADPTAASGTIGTLNGVSGSSLTYGQSLTSDADGGALTSTHRKLGTAAMATDSHVGGQVLVSGGPCVTCHMSGKHHTLEMDAAAFSVCVKCHTKEGTTTLTADNFKPVFIDAQAVFFNDALNLATTLLLSKYNISYNPASYPYFYDQALAGVAVKDWTRGGTLSAADAKKLMGACFNINLLTRDSASYVHARTYARRLLYDSIDFLDNKLMDKSVSATAVATTPAVYVNGGTSATSSDSFNYLVKFNGAAGALDTTKERP